MGPKILLNCVRLICIDQIVVFSLSILSTYYFLLFPLSDRSQGDKRDSHHHK